MLIALFYANKHLFVAGLRKLVAKYEIMMPVVDISPTSSIFPEPEVIIVETRKFTPDKITPRCRIENATGGSNVICVSFARLEDNSVLVLCGGGNKIMNVYRMSEDQRTADIGKYQVVFNFKITILKS